MTQLPEAYVLVLNAAEGLLQLLIARRDASADAARSRGPVSPVPPFAGPDGAVYAPLYFASLIAPSQGAEMLAPVLRDACARLHIAPCDLRRIAVVRGPGSFTGLRLVLATAAGLVRATGAEQAGLAYLPLLAQSAALALAPVPACGRGPDSAVFWVVTHARRQLVHMQGFSSSAAPLTEVLVCSPEEGAARIRERGRNKGREGDSGGGRDGERNGDCGGKGFAFVLGSGLERNGEAFAAALSAGIAAGEVVLLPSLYSHPSAEALLRGAAAAEYGREDVTPLYVRQSDAEENLERIARTLGLDPEAARCEAERLTRLAPEGE